MKQNHFSTHTFFNQIERVSAGVKILKNVLDPYNTTFGVDTKQPLTCDRIKIHIKVPLHIERHLSDHSPHQLGELAQKRRLHSQRLPPTPLIKIDLERLRRILQQLHQHLVSDLHTLQVLPLQHLTQHLRIRIQNL